MSEHESSPLATLDAIATDVVAKHAAHVDHGATFPHASIDALAAAGLLGLISAKEVGGLGLGPRAAALAIERLAKECASTAMIVTMHYSGVAVLEKHASEQVRRDAASGKHLSTLAFSEVGSRSQFWAPVGTATRAPGGIALNGKKSWVTSARRATAYVWSSQPVEAAGASTIWLVPRETAGVHIAGSFDGLGLRGNDSTPVNAEHAIVPEGNMLGADGAGLGVMLEVVLPLFNLMNAACSIGITEGAVAKAIAHVSGTGFEHDGTRLRDLPTVRSYVARMRIATDQARLLMLDTIDAMEKGRPDAMLRVLECKAAAAETANQVLDTAMRVSGGAAFRKEVGVERAFRDARAASVMAPTTDALYDFIGKAITGLPVF